MTSAETFEILRIAHDAELEGRADEACEMRAGVEVDVEWRRMTAQMDGARVRVSHSDWDWLRWRRPIALSTAVRSAHLDSIETTLGPSISFSGTAEVNADGVVARPGTVTHWRIGRDTGTVIGEAPIRGHSFDWCAIDSYAANAANAGSTRKQSAKRRKKRRGWA